MNCGTTNKGLAEVTIPQLVARIYDEAPPSERCRVLEHLMQPLGALSLAVIADGIFARLWFQRGWQSAPLRPEDTLAVRSSDVVELVTHAQQVCAGIVETLVQIVAASPSFAGSAAAAMLIATLVTQT
jgi:hypothetical protein